MPVRATVAEYADEEMQNSGRKDSRPLRATLASLLNVNALQSTAVLNPSFQLMSDGADYLEKLRVPLLTVPH